MRYRDSGQANQNWTWIEGVYALKWIAAAAVSTILSLQNTVPDHLSINFKEQTVANVERQEYEQPVWPLVDQAKLDSLMKSLVPVVYKQPENARFGNSGAIIPEVIGYTLDEERFAELFYDFMYGEGSPAFEVPRRALYPRVDSEILAPLREKAIGYYVTYYNSRNQSRSHNIHLAAKAIDNTVVFPGETFSFNETVGIRTQEKGYKQAPVIVRGELSEGIGGGICQVSSTLFNAIDRAGLQVVHRYSHSRHVPYVPSGRDATVSWGGPDFAFRNPYNQPVLLRTFSGQGRVQITVYSSEMIEFYPREVPGVSKPKRMPDEIRIETNAEPGDQLQPPS